MRAGPVVLKGVTFSFSQSLVVSCVVNCVLINASVLACSS